MATKRYKGECYYTLDSSGPDDFALELWRRRRVRADVCIAVVSCSDRTREPKFDVFVDEGKAPPEIVAEFVADAKTYPQGRLKEWHSGCG